MRKTVAELMSVDVVTVESWMPLDEALALLVESDATDLCVIDTDGRMEGIVTDYELLKASLSGDLRERTISEYISRAVTVVGPAADVDQVVPLFRDGVCSRVFVCEEGRPLGQLSRTTVLRYLAHRKSDARQPVLSLNSTSADGSTVTVQPRQGLPKAPQFLGTSVLGSIGTSVRMMR